MNRRPLIAGNWKMHKTPDETEKFIREFTRIYAQDPEVEVLIIPPFTSLERAGRLLSGTGIALGAQDLYYAEEGAYTGEISTRMLRACGCTYALVGHSERRALFHEDDSLINRKLRAALAAALTPILCVGETLTEHQAGKVEERIVSELSRDLAGVNRDEVAHIVIAYEPIWAIGTGETATPQEAQGTIQMIRTWVAKNYTEQAAEAIRVLYGGSVKPSNAAELLAQPDIDGALVGGASLDPSSFAQIAHAALDR